jgi:hypothetical protein
MDVARILFTLSFALLNAINAHAAAPTASAPKAHTANFAGQGDWSSAGPPTAPTISANRNDRYAYPQPPNYGTTTQPTSIVDRTQNAFSETANTLRDGFNASVRAATDNSQGVNQQFQNWSDAASRQLQSAGSSLRSATGQTPGTTPTRSQVSNPFVTAPAAPTTPKARNGLAPPTSWPTTTSSSPTLTAPTWSDSAVPAAPDSGILSASPTPLANQNSNGSWTSIGSSIAAPPMLIPQLAVSQSNFASNNNPTSTATAFPAGNTRSQASIHSPLDSSSQTSPATTTARTAPAADNWTTNWDNSSRNTGSNSFNNSNNTGASISRSGTNSPQVDTNRYADLPTTQPVSVGTKDQKATSTANNKSADFWADDSWSRPQSIAPNTIDPRNSSATISKTGQTANANSAPPTNQPPANSPVLNPPAIPSTSNTFATASPTSAPQPATANTTTAAKPAQQTAATPAAAPTGEQKPWVALLAIVLVLAGSLAANLFLGWSYLDARQKYQSLVRRTADTFRRTKAAAA